jgi:1,6-anhydro-N-acetylmuramate kinase
LQAGLPRGRRCATHELRAIRRHWKKRLPVLGLNAGHLGFLLNEADQVFEHGLEAEELILRQMPLLYVETRRPDGTWSQDYAFNEAWIERALQLPFFALPPPKSLDRNDFAALKLGDIAPADGAATLTAFTAAAIAKIVPLVPKLPKSWIVAGGGARNLTMLRMLRERVAPATVEAAEGLGWASDAIEAQAFGFLAARGLKGLPLSYPATTGVPFPMTGGIIARP